MDRRREEEVVILVKALPRPSRQHGETVCCAGVTIDREWRRLYPVRFRQLGESKFVRWQWLKYRWQSPRSDARRESRHVFEDTLAPARMMPESERADFLAPIVVGSVTEAKAKGASLALVRPIESRFRWKRKSQKVVDAEHQLFQAVARQPAFFDHELAVMEPLPFEFRIRFRDEDGWHEPVCSDWETSAAFWNLRKQYSEAQALRHLDETYNRDYPTRGMTVALGNMAKRPQTWLLLGVIRLDAPSGLRLVP